MVATVRLRAANSALLFGSRHIYTEYAWRIQGYDLAPREGEAVTRW